MRIVSLAIDQDIIIGDDIVVKLLDIDGDEVQIGIEYSDGMFTEPDGRRRTSESGPVPQPLFPAFPA